jgi:parallel beta-helix repeat protein
MAGKLNLTIFLAALAFLAGPALTSAGTIYVDAAAPGPGHDGSTWATAYIYLQDALAGPVYDDEIWVAEGLYKPDCNSVNPAGSGNREATFQLVNGVALYGGFPHRPALGTAATSGVALGDLDTDGDLDAFLANYVQANKVWLNDAAAGFLDTGQSLGGLAYSYQVALADLDADGDLDACVANDGNPSKVYVNDGHGVFTDSGQTIAAGLYTCDLELGDLDADGDGDLFLITYAGANKVWLNDGNGLFSDTFQNLGSSESYAVALGDLDDDGDLDAFVANDGAYSYANKVWLNDGNATFIVTGQNLGSSVSRGVALGDVDGDGDLDAFTANFFSANKVWLNDGHASFSDSAQTLGSSLSYAVALGDLDADGDLDAFVANNNRPDAVWLNDGFGAFSDSGQSLGNSAGHDVVLGDLDGDGDLDAFVANDGQPDTVWINNGLANFTDANDPRFDQRNCSVHQTILSGDLAGNDADVNDPSELLTEPTRAENSYHVVRANGTDANTVLDGFTITAGNADGPAYPQACGGGMFSYSGSPIITNCRFSGNSARDGGGMYNSYSSPTVTDCTFSGNSADGCAGGMFNYSNSGPMLANCTFSGNFAKLEGGGMSNYLGPYPTLANCIFSSNTAQRTGGGMSNDFFCSPTLTNCTLSGNSAGSLGGGVHNFNRSSAILTNCILWADTAANGAEIALTDTAQLTISYSDVQGAQAATHVGPGCTLNWGATNIDDDPDFADANNPDLNLRDYHLRPGSPCIDTGDNNSLPADAADLDGDGNTAEHIPWDLDGRPRIVDGDCNDTEILDMGAYEFAWPYIGDFDADCDVDLPDYAVLALAWLSRPGRAEYNPACDISLPHDSYIDCRDLGVLTANWLAGK